MSRAIAVCLAVLLIAGCNRGSAKYDIAIHNAVLYDGTGGPPRRGELAINKDVIAEVGDLKGQHGRIDIDAGGMAVAPGFINMLSWATDSLIEDGRSESDLRQGVTLEVFGEGESMGPLTDEMKRSLIDHQGDIKYKIAWTSLSDYLKYLQKRGISTNVASFIGASTVRANVLGYANRAPTPEELERMKALVHDAMRHGALGVGSALIYTPGTFAKTDELVALAEVAAGYNGMYISHIRSEGNALLPAIDEVIDIARRARIRAEVYHLKAAGRTNWDKLSAAIDKIESARREGLSVTADMYTYTAGATGLDASMPPWVQEGGLDAWRKRLQDPAVRARVKQEMITPTDQWESLYLAAGSPDKILLTGFKKLKQYTGKTLADVARSRGKSPEETAMDLVVEDGSRIEAIYFIASEDNLRRQIALPWVSFGSDAESQAPRGPFLQYSVHPRTYGNFARLLGKYVRDEKVIPLQEAIRRLTTLPAINLHIARRGELRPNFMADIVIFDPNTIQDHATYENPRQFATGVEHVFVNGVQVIRNGEHTGAKPGRAVFRAE